MATKSGNPNTKPELAKLTPNMTRKQKAKNLLAALKKSGFVVQPSEKQKDAGGLS